tara:strand:- start:78 stop:230 length:153 start_codon:yes stop_codon:yes gene_type:complete
MDAVFLVGLLARSISFFGRIPFRSINHWESHMPKGVGYGKKKKMKRKPRK